MVMSPLIKKLMFVRQFDIDEGKIEMLGDREIMISASVLLELQEQDQSKLYEAAKTSSFKNIKGVIEHSKVYGGVKEVMSREFAQLGKKIGNSEEGTIRVLQEVFNVYGLGNMAIPNMDNKNKKAVVTVKDSALAEEWVGKNKKRSAKPVCTLTAGVLAGVFSYIFSKKVECAEESCKTQGKDYCLFNVG